MAPEKPNSQIEKTPDQPQTPINIPIDASAKLVQINSENLEAKRLLPDKSTQLDTSATRAKSAIESAAQAAKVSTDQAILDSSQRLLKLA
ncbi:hypothetical protein IT411_00725 [Candidatus Peregrinibacteria bacterium]|nr:hypothetical protein [Candidatus Peregrinibacteria bacterium]